MVIKDITDSYIEHILKEDNLEEYEKEFPELFQYYFTFWAQRDYWHKELNKKQVSERKNLILSQLPIIEKKLIEHGFDTKSIRVILMVGQGTTNGHAFKYQNEFAIFLPIEEYETIEQVDIFVTHEILHALHYSAQPDFYFKTQEEKDSVFRQLATEGLATYLAKEVLGISNGKALWADYLSDDELSKWIKSCENEKQNLFKETRALIKEKSTKPDLFYANDANDIRKYRAGYFIGLEIAKEIARKNNFSVHDLLQIEKGRFEKMAKDILSR
jgi:uncharacterized protein YjaZ